MTIATRFPEFFAKREPIPHQADIVRQRPEVALPARVSEIDILYEDADENVSERRIRPLALSVLASGEFSLVSTCRLRAQYRTFAFSRICRASVAGLEGKTFNGAQLIGLFRNDVARLMTHDAAINGDPVELDRSAFEVIARHDISRLLKEVRREVSATGEAEVCLEALIKSVQTFACDLPESDVSNRFAITVTAHPDAEGLAVHTDVPTYAAQVFRDGSNHLRLLHVARKAPIATAMRALHATLMQDPQIGHPEMRLSLVVRRGEVAGSFVARLAIDDLWLDRVAAPMEILTAKLRHARRALARLTDLQPLHADAQIWRLAARTGSWMLRANAKDDVAPRIMALTGISQLAVTALAPCHAPV